MIDRVEVELWERAAQPVTVPLSFANGQILTGRARLHGWSFTSAASACQAALYDGYDFNGQVVGFPACVAGGPGNFWAGDGGIRISAGLYVTYAADKLPDLFVVYVTILDMP